MSNNGGDFYNALTASAMSTMCCTIAVFIVNIRTKSRRRLGVGEKELVFLHTVIFAWWDTGWKALVCFLSPVNQDSCIRVRGEMGNINTNVRVHK